MPTFTEELTRRSLLNAIVVIYEHLVAERAHFRYRVGRTKGTHAVLELIADAIAEAKAPVGEYLEAQFEQLSPDWCRSKFRRVWPPLPLLQGEKAVARWHRWKQYRARATDADERAKQRRAERLERSRELWQGIAERAEPKVMDELRRLAVLNGSIDLSFLVWLVRRDQLPVDAAARLCAARRDLHDELVNLLRKEKLWPGDELNQNP